MVIREYQPLDLLTLAGLFYNTVHTVNGKDYTKEQLDAWATGTVDLEKWNQSFQEHYSLAAVEDETIIGFGDIDKTGYLHRLFVHSDYQRRGVAAAICSQLEQAVHGNVEVSGGRLSMDGGARDVVVYAHKATPSGSVTDHVAGTPLPGAAVTAVKEGETKATASATVRENGAYTLKLPAGIFTVTASKSGYKTQEKTVTVAAGDEKTQDFALVLNAGTVSGTVTDSKTGAPVSGAFVTLGGTDATSFSGVADSAGAYTIEDVPAGNYEVKITAQGYSAHIETISVAANSTTTHDAQLTPGKAVLKGMVVDGENSDAPISGAVVSIYDTAATPALQKTITTASDGTFTAELEGGTYTLETTAKGYSPYTMTAVLEAGQETSTTLRLTPGGTNWSFSGGTLTVWGDGKMNDYAEYPDFNRPPWYKSYKDVITKIVVEDGVTHVGNYAFADLRNVEFVQLPGSLTSIGNYAFRSLANLPQIEIPESVTSIGNYAFQNLYKVTAIRLPDGLRTLGEHAFNNCTALTRINIPAGITEILPYTFDHCGFTSFTIPDTVTTIGAGAFQNCQELVSVTIPDSVTAIPESTFQGCTSLTGVKLPNQLKTIGKQAFFDCKALASIGIPDTVTSIGESAFGYLAITSITIPDSATTLGNFLFKNCEKLTNITLPAGLTSISDGMFMECKALQTLQLPSGITTIGGNAFRDSGLTGIDLPSGVRSIGDSVFYSCRTLSRVNIPDTVTGVGANAFQGCDALTSITFPESVQTIGKGVLAYGAAHRDVYILNKTVKITHSMFSDGNYTVTVYFAGSKDDWNANYGSNVTMVYGWTGNP